MKLTTLVNWIISASDRFSQVGIRPRNRTYTLIYFIRIKAYLYTSAARPLPTSGPNQNTQCSVQTSATTAGPSERAGFIEVPVKGTATKCPTRIARPIATGARWRIPLGSIAVAKTTNTKANVSTASSRIQQMTIHLLLRHSRPGFLV